MLPLDDVLNVPGSPGVSMGTHPWGCMLLLKWRIKEVWAALLFQWAPTLGGECYKLGGRIEPTEGQVNSFNGHPPLGVNATR